METMVSQWGEEGERPTPNPRLDALFASMSAMQMTEIDCARFLAWELVSSIDRIGEFSPECVEAWWLDSNDIDSVGSRFGGRNRKILDTMIIEWIRLCTIDAWDPLTRFAWTVGDRFDGTPATKWEFELEGDDGHVLIRQRFQHLPDGLSGIRSGAEQNIDRASLVVQE